MYRKFFTSKSRLMSVLLAIGVLVTIGILHAINSHEAGNHVPTIGGLAFGLLPTFIGDVKPMELDEIAKAVQAKMTADLDGKLDAKAKETTGFITKFVEQMKTEIASLKDAYKPEDIAKKIKALAGEVARSEVTKLTKEEDEYIRAYFCEKVDRNDGHNTKCADIVKTLGAQLKADYGNVGTAGEGGNVVPVQFANAIAALAAPDSVVLQDATLIPLGMNTGGSFKVPTDLGGITFAYPGEGAAATASKPAFGLETITPKDGTALVPFTRELMDFNNVNLVGFIAQKIAEAEAYDIDYQILSNTAMTGTAFRDSAALVSKVIAQAGGTFAITLDELLEVMGLLTNKGNYKWYFHPSVLWARILSLKDGNSAYPFQTEWNKAEKNVFGYPVRECATGTMYANADSGVNRTFGMLTDMKQSVYLTMPGGQKFEISTTASFVVGGTTYHCMQDGLVLISVRRYLGAAFPDFHTASKYTGVKLRAAAA
jgi:HK97 family phage major capsid protein